MMSFLHVLSCLLRSIHRLSQLERLDLGSNEFSEVVRNVPLLLSFRAIINVKSFREKVWEEPDECFSASQTGANTS